MSLFTDGVDRLNTQVGKWASYLIYGMTGVVVYEVIARKVFSAPTSWAFDLTVYLGGAFFLLGFGYCLFLDNHVRVDVISAKFPPRLRRWLEIVCFFIFFLPFALGLFYAGLDYAVKSWLSGELGQSSWKPPLYWIKPILPLGFGLLLLQGIANILKLTKK